MALEVGWQCCPQAVGMGAIKMKAEQATRGSQETVSLGGHCFHSCLQVAAPSPCPWFPVQQTKQTLSFHKLALVRVLSQQKKKSKLEQKSFFKDEKGFSLVFFSMYYVFIYFVRISQMYIFWPCLSLPSAFQLLTDALNMSPSQLHVFFRIKTKYQVQLSV